jgi:hypothetical protein
MERNIMSKQDMDARLILKDCNSVDHCILKLNALIESWPVAYGFKFKHGDKWALDQEKDDRSSTHQCRLAFIEPIVRGPCKHEALVTVKIAGFKTDARYFCNVLEAAKCKHCGVELQATWSEKMKCIQK